MPGLVSFLPYCHPDRPENKQIPRARSVRSELRRLLSALVVCQLEKSALHGHSVLISSLVDPEQACDNICVSRSLNSEVRRRVIFERAYTNTTQHQYELLDVLAFNFCSGEYRLLVIDSVMALFRTDYSGRGELAERQQALGQFLKRLAALAEEFNVCVMMVRLTAIASYDLD